ncbi:uncharacterized protein LOC123498665 isoform X2 [Portunus trituberculatus]|uniref:uncharacterized protein LOC123498665 isoform X2 n=1 Tax=Portunus trituberculatus TaxID=210409 RepID=UPI001E1D0B57|nr:uncharacterized protein LOC123498665 isoform X2 [Portunus trituberculatus]
MEVTEKLNSAFPYVRRSREQVEKKWQNFLSKGKRALSARKQQHHRTDLAPQPDHVDQRIEHDGHVDPEPLTPSTQDTGIQLQETVAPSEEAQPILGPWTGFEPVRLETPRIPKHTWFHCTTVAPKRLALCQSIEE